MQNRGNNVKNNKTWDEGTCENKIKEAMLIITIEMTNRMET
jgi:hypothetical protein